MIKTLRIQNFKSWQDTGEMHLAPITILFGSNSSGKSSVGQLLMLLKQSIEMSDRKTVLYIGNERSPVNFGTPSNIIYQHDINNPLCFSYSWGLDEPVEFRDAVHKKKYFCNEVKFSTEIVIGDASKQTMEVSKFSYYLISPEGLPVEVGMKKQGGKANSNREYEITCDNYSLVRTSGRAWGIQQPTRFYGFPDEAIAYYQNAAFLSDVNLWHEQQFAKIDYLGPLRSKAKRIYSWSGQTPSSVGYSGDETVPAILAAKAAGRMINYGNRRLRRDFTVLLAEMLQRMGLVKEIKVEPIAQGRQDYDVRVKLSGSEEWMGIPDVGFGVSQVLPVLVEMFYAAPGSTIIMEQPELHLHPSAQAGLADVVITAIKSKEDYKARNVQLIIETHSEHFLRRLQRRLAEEEIDSEDIAAYVAQNTTQPATLEPLQLDLFGNISNWPKDFFGDITGDMYSQANAALLRRKETQSSTK